MGIFYGDMSKYFMRSRLLRDSLLIILPLISFPLILWLQVKLGYDVSLFPLYMVAIAALTWRFGLGAGLASATLAAGLWLWGLDLTKTELAYKWAAYYNATSRLILFVGMVIFIIGFRRVRDRQEKLMESMRGLLRVCNCCGAIQGSDGEWVPLGELPARKKEEPRICPTCARSVRG